MFAVNGILFKHESEWQGKHLVPERLPLLRHVLRSDNRTSCIWEACHPLGGIRKRLCGMHMIDASEVFLYL